MKLQPCRQTRSTARPRSPPQQLTPPSEHESAQGDALQRLQQTTGSQRRSAGSPAHHSQCLHVGNGGSVHNRSGGTNSDRFKWHHVVVIKKNAAVWVREFGRTGACSCNRATAQIITRNPARIPPLCLTHRAHCPAQAPAAAGSQPGQRARAQNATPQGHSAGHRVQESVSKAGHQWAGCCCCW